MNATFRTIRTRGAATLSRLHQAARTKATALAAGSLVLASQAHAAMPAGVQEELDGMQDNGLVIAGAFLVAVIAFAVIKILRTAK